MKVGTLGPQNGVNSGSRAQEVRPGRLVGRKISIREGIPTCSAANLSNGGTSISQHPDAVRRREQAAARYADFSNPDFRRVGDPGPINPPSQSAVSRQINLADSLMLLEDTTSIWDCLKVGCGLSVTSSSLTNSQCIWFGLFLRLIVMSYCLRESSEEWMVYSLLWSLNWTCNFMSCSLSIVAYIRSILL